MYVYIHGRKSLFEHEYRCAWVNKLSPGYIQFSFIFTWTIASQCLLCKHEMPNSLMFFVFTVFLVLVSNDKIATSRGKSLPAILEFIERSRPSRPEEHIQSHDA